MVIAWGANFNVSQQVRLYNLMSSGVEKYRRPLTIVFRCQSARINLPRALLDRNLRIEDNSEQSKVVPDCVAPPDGHELFLSTCFKVSCYRLLLYNRKCTTATYS